MSNNSAPAPANLIGVLPQLSIGVMALLLLGGVFWLNAQERRFEADRADRDRELVMVMLRQSIEQAGQDREEMQERSDRFIENQAIFLEQQGMLVGALENQAAILRELKTMQEENTRVMKQSLREETQILIDAVTGEKR